MVAAPCVRVAGSCTVGTAGPGEPRLCPFYLHQYSLLQSLSPSPDRLSSSLYPLKSAPIAAFGAVALDLQQSCRIGAHCAATWRNTQYRVSSSAISGCGRTPLGLPRIPVSCSSATPIAKRWPHWSTGSTATSDSRFWSRSPGWARPRCSSISWRDFATTAHTAFLFQPQPNPVELLQSVLHELGTILRGDFDSQIVGAAQPGAHPGGRGTQARNRGVG